MDEPDLDCLIVGGGPAGLTAAIYLARFHLAVTVVDAGGGRAATIPCTRNHAGFPDGISGAELIALMTAQAQRYGAKIAAGRVTRLDRTEGGFVAEWGKGPQSARSVLLATGVANRRPAIDEALHDDALARGLIRYCPICDGYEVTDKKVGVIGTGGNGVAEAAFLRAYTADVTLIAPDGAHDLAEEDRAKAVAHGVRLIDGPCRVSGMGEDTITVAAADGLHVFASVYPALGSDVHSELAGQIGVSVSGESACILVDAHQRTNVPGVYAAGDVVLGLDQISHAMGEGGVAATTIRNDLAKARALLR